MIWSSMSVTLETSRTVEPGPAQVADEHVVDERLAGRGRGAAGRTPSGRRGRCVTVPGSRMASSRTSLRGGVVQAQHARQRYESPARSVLAGMVPGATCRPYPCDRCRRSRTSRRSTASRRAGPSAGRPTASTASTAPRDARPTCSRSTPRRRPCRARSTWAPCSATPRPTPSPATSGWRGKAVFFPIGWDDNGLATERRVQNYFGVRCDPSQPYDPDFQPPFRGDAPKDHQRGPDLAAQLRRAVPRADGHRRGRVRGAVPPPRPVVRLVAAVHDDQRRQPAHQPAGVPAQPGPRRGLQRRGARRCGTSTTAPPSPRPRSRTASGPAPTTCSRSTAPTATC